MLVVSLLSLIRSANPVLILCWRQEAQRHIKSGSPLLLDYRFLGILRIFREINLWNSEYLLYLRTPPAFGIPPKVRSHVCASTQVF